jgi:hypothetical protein
LLFAFLREVTKSEGKTTKAEKRENDGETMDPVHVVLKRAIAAPIWQQQIPSGFAYYDFSLSRSWKSISTEKAGESRNFFDSNQADLIEVIQGVSA